MLYQGHLLLGVLVFLAGRIFIVLPNTGSEVIFFLMVLLGSILPDIDEENSKIAQWSGIVGKTFSKIFPHRGILHSLLFFTSLYFLLSYYWQQYYATGLILGYVAHIIGDGITPAGVRIFYPLRFKVRGPMRVGSLAEKVLTLILFIVVVKIALF